MANSSSPWDAYCSLISCRLVVCDKRPGVRPVGISETLRLSLSKLVMHIDGNQVETECGNLQLCAGLKAGIEGTTHTVGKRRIERLIRRSSEEEAGSVEEEEEEESENLGGLLNNLTIDTGVTEEEATEGLEAAFGMEVDGDGEDEGVREVK